MKRLLAFFVAVVLLGAQSLQAQWIQINGPSYGGDIRCFAVNGSNLFAGTDGGGVFLSTNNGTSWTAVNAGLPTNTSVYALAVNGSNLFAGTFRGGVFLSTNNGTSWTAVNTGLTNLNVSSLAVNGLNLFAGTIYYEDGGEDDHGGVDEERDIDEGRGVFLSTNNGASWTPVNTGLTNTRIRALVVNGLNLFAGTGGGVFLSTNNGTSWVNAGLTNTFVWSLAVNGSNLFAGTHGGGVFLSANNGTSWTAVNNGLLNTGVLSLAVNGSNLFAGTGDGVFLSTNNGTSWTAVNTGLTSRIVDALAVNGSNLFAGTEDGGVWRRPLSEMVTGVEDDFSQAPFGFTLEQNYPNPFWSEATSRSAGNPATTIRYQLPTTTQVVLKIYNTFGQEVRTLVNARQPAGVNAVVWDGRDESGKEVSSGIYIYRLQTGESIQSRKLSFVR